MSSAYAFTRPPLEHQRRDFERFKDEPLFGLFYEQRCGKSKVVLDLFQYRYRRGEVDALVILAYPSGVPPVWIDELPKDLAPDLQRRVRYVLWKSGKTTKGEQREDALALRTHDGPIVVAMNCEALNSKPAFDYLRWLLQKRRVMLVADEASWAANWSSRTKKLLTLAGTLRSNTRPHPNLVVKGILDGTPVEEGPVEIYHPAQFLRFGLLGFTSKTAFKNHYIEYETEEDPLRPGEVRTVLKERHDPKSGRVVNTFPIFKGYRNLDDLHARMMRFGSRVLRADVSDAPAKVYQTRYFELTLEQRRVYDDLRDLYAAELRDGTEVNAAGVLLRMTRLQMVARNYYPPEATSEPCPTCAGFAYDAAGDECAACSGLGALVTRTGLRRIDAHNPAAEALGVELRASHGKPFVVWCRFQQDVTDAVAACEAAGAEVFRYDGTVKEREREERYQAYRAGQRDGIVATILSGLQRGKDLRRAGLLIYYSNEFSLRARRQSEDRAEGLSNTESTDVVDLAALDSRDLEAIAALREKRSIAQLILKDPPGSWL